jgi:GAF domain-containing protein
VLKVISSSPGELAPVFDAMLANAVRICEAKFGLMCFWEGTAFRVAAMHGLPPAHAEMRRRDPMLPLIPGTTLGRVAATKAPAQTADVQAEPAYLNNPTPRAGLIGAGGARSIVGVPMLKDAELIGAILIYRQEVSSFSDKQVGLLANFAAQAVIAIENARLLNELRQRTDDLSESLEQQTATSEVLKVISGSPGELEPVFNAMLNNAIRVCQASYGALFRFENGAAMLMTTLGLPQRMLEYLQRIPFRPSEHAPIMRVARTKQLVHVIDFTTDQAYLERDSMAVAGVEIAGIRTLLIIPMLKEDDLIGAVAVFRQEVRPFTEKQIELVQNFAAQAVIAIENTRLLNELRESLAQQTATSEVLSVISSSPGELRPVFQAMLENATRICEANFGVLNFHEDGALRAGAMHNVPAAFATFLQDNQPYRPVLGSVLDRVIRTKQVCHTADNANESIGRAATLGGARSIVCVPMLKDNELIGTISIYRQEVRPFTNKQIQLLSNFAAQAVIAIENTRLLNELRESLQQQMATSEVLQVISSSPGELEPVFQKMLENAVQICEAKFGVLFQWDGEVFRSVAAHGVPPALTELQRASAVRPVQGTALGCVATTKEAVQIADVSAVPSYHDDPGRRALVEVAGARTLISVPMLKDNELIGTISIYRQEVRPFTEKQIELVQNFAAQAVIAIENTRLLGELRESLQQQTATADVLKVISRSTFDLQTVLQTLVESAARLCDAERTLITRQRNGVFYRAEAFGFSREFLDYVRDIPIEPERGSAFGRALLERRAVHIPDVKADPEYTLVEGQKLGDYRTVLAVPMLREGVPTGVLSLTRSEVRPFTEKQIELASTFADQAAIAIENVRLFESVEARTRELAQSLEDLQTAQDRLVQTQKLASLGQLTAGIAHEIKNPLNFVNNFSSLSTEMLDELQEALQRGQFDRKTRAEIDELTETLRANLDKIEQHGKRADSIVKNMLLHSREGSGEHRPVDVNSLVEESLNLAYHGARAEKQGFNITLERSFDPAAGSVDVFPQEITRVLLNLISNGFYAATKRKAEVGDGYEPTLAAATKDLGDRVEIRIRDNGTGIPPEVKDKMFNPFFTTKPPGEGTGLGLSLSHDIIVKQHAGSIEVDTAPGQFTEFRVILPRTAAMLAKSGGRA